MPRKTAAISRAEPAEIDVLRAFRLMEYQNTRVTMSLAHQLEIGATDLRALVFLSLGETTTPSKLGEFLSLTSGATTSLTDRLVTRGFLHREPSESDRRSVLLSLTDDGKAAVRQFGDFYLMALKRAVVPDERPVIVDLLQRIAQSLATSIEDERRGD